MKTEDAIKARIAELKGDVNVLEAYAAVKNRTKDRHGVEDAMSDLRDLEAAIDALEWALSGMRWGEQQ